MSFLKLLFSFAPWIAFLAISGPSMFRLKLGVIVAAVLVVVMGISKLHRGIILWAGVVFFIYALIAVVWLNNMWAVRHMGILANGALATGTWLTVLVGKPFTLDYAREHTDPALWDTPVFIKTNYLMTSVWGTVFTISVVNAWIKMSHPHLPALMFELIQYTLMIVTMLFSTWYPKYLKQHREKLAAETVAGDFISIPMTPRHRAGTK